MNIKEILQFINIDANFYNLLKNYEQEPEKYSKELYIRLIEKTKYDKEVIKSFTNDFSNTLLLKTYLGKDDKDIFNKMAEAGKENKSEYFHEIYSQVLFSNKVSTGYKKSLSLTIFQTINNDKYGKHLSIEQINFGKKILDDILLNLNHQEIELEDLNWLEELINYLDINKIKDLVYNIYKKNINNKNDFKESYLKSFRTFYFKLIENIKQSETIFENKTQVKWLFNVGKWIIYNLKDLDDNSQESQRKRIFDAPELLHEFSNLEPFLDFLTINEIEELLDLNKQKYEDFLNTKTNIFKNEEFKNKNIYFSSFTKYFKNTDYFKMTFDKFWKDNLKQLELIKEISKLTFDLTDKDLKEVKDTLIWRPTVHSKEKYFKDIDEKNIEIAGKVKEILGKNQINTYSYNFNIENEKIRTMFPEYSNKIIKKLFDKEIDPRTILLISNTGYDDKQSFINHIVLNVYENNSYYVGQINTSNDLSLFNSDKFFNNMLNVYENTSEKNKNYLIKYIYKYINTLPELLPEHEKYIEELIKYKGIKSIIKDNIKSISNEHNAKNQRESMVGTKIISNGKTSLQIFKKYLEKNIEIYVSNNELITDYIDYLNSSFADKEKYIKVLDKFYQNLNNKEENNFSEDFNKDKHFFRILMNIRGMYVSNQNQILEDILIHYFHIYKNDKNNVLETLRISYNENYKNLIDKIKSNDFGKNVNSIEISKFIVKREKELEDKKQKNNLALPNEIIPITNEKRQEALSIIEKNLKNIISNKKEKKPNESNLKNDIKLPEGHVNLNELNFSDIKI